MKKPHLDQWQRRMIIENYGISGPLFNLNLQLKIFIRNIEKSLQLRKLSS
jgi:hypothetical protein